MAHNSDTTNESEESGFVHIRLDSEQKRIIRQLGNLARPRMNITQYINMLVKRDLSRLTKEDIEALQRSERLSTQFLGEGEETPSVSGEIVEQRAAAKKASRTR